MYRKYTNNIINLDELDKILNDYITTHIEKFDFYLISCELIIESENIETECFYNTDIISIKRNFLYNIYNFIPRIYNPRNVCKIKQTILKTINDRCNMT